MDHGQDEDVIRSGYVDNAVALEDQFADVVAFGFRNASPDSGIDEAPGGSLSGKGQKAVHTESKWLLKYAPEAEAGDYIIIKGRLPPCGHVGKTELGCYKAMEDFAKSYKVYIDYFDQTGRSWSFGPKGFVKRPFQGWYF